MYNNYKIVVNTAAGRRRYMQWLIPFVVSSEIVDRYDIWVNTHNMVDIEFFKKCAEAFPKINLVWQPDGIVNGNESINAFYRQCTDVKTIYFKMDDDIVWMEDDTIEKMVKFRVENPNFFLVSPLVVNNALSTYLLQERGKLKLNQYYNSCAGNHVLWGEGEFAVQLHQWFLNKKLKTKEYASLHLGIQPMGMTRFSINSILWFGAEMKKMNGMVPGDDEEFLSCIYPCRKGMANCWNGDAIMVHFAFYPQREFLDKAQILEQYGEFLAEEWSKNANMKKIHDTVQSIMRFCKENEKVLSVKPSPYQRVTTSDKSLLHSGFLKKYFHKFVIRPRKAIKGWCRRALTKKIKYITE